MIIQVKDRTLSTTSAEQCISDNSDYKITFLFDEEWEGHTKTVRFVSGKKYKDVLVDAEDECNIPLEVLNPGILRIGVFSSEYATTELFVNVKGSVLQSVAKQIDYISEDIYRQLLRIIDSLQAGEVSQEQISEAVAQYMKENPIEGSVSKEEIEKAVTTYMEANAENFKGETGKDGEAGQPGESGQDGVGIVSIEKTSTEGIIDTYTITYTDNTTSTFNVTNGKDGENSSATITDEQIANAVSEYLIQNPVSGLTNDEKELLEKLNISGDGTKYLADDGTYKNVEATVYYYKPVIIETTAGIYRKNDGTIGDSTIETDTYIKRVSATNAEQYVAVVEGEVYRLTIGSIGAIPTSFGATQCVFLDDGDNVIANAFDTSNWKDAELVTVPENATKMHFTVWSGSEFKLEKQTTEPYGVVNEFELLNEMTKLQKEEQTFSRKTFAPFDRAYITFVNDDCRSSVGDIVDVFVQKGVPLCLASLYGAFTNLTTNDRTVLDVVRLAVENGGEVLAHNPTPITETEIDDFNSLYNVFAKNKEMLEMYGFDVNGIILAGGMGQIVGSQKTDKWARKYYQYSDLYGNSEFGYPYYHYRTALSNLTLEKAKAKIDEAIASKEWVIFYLHEWMEFSQSDMEALLDYINEKDARELGIVTYKQMYDNFCVKYPKQLVNITANKVTTVYEAGNEIKTNDVTVTAYYDDGSIEEISTGITVDLSEVDTATAGEYWCAVTYSGKTVYLPISIYANGDRTILYSGKEGSYITWELYSDGVMEMTNTATWKQNISTYTADGGQPWAEHMSMIKKLKFNAGNYAIGTIGDYAFCGAENLTELDFSENTGGVTINQYAFGECGFTAPVIENVYKIDTNAFNGSSMAEITLGVGVLSYNTFAGCSNLKTVRFINDTMTIDGNAFYGVRGIVTDIYVPWENGAVANAPWGASSAEIHYDTVF